MRNAPPEAAVERFRRDLERLIPTDGAFLGVAVSGGPDSLALLLLAHAGYEGRVLAATVDHGLRPESAAEAQHVAQICLELGIPHETLMPARPITGSLQASAREARYAALDLWAEAHGIDAILTAHHADDQAETLLMRLNRGSGVAGLAGVRAVNGHIVRPLLHWRRHALFEIAEASPFEAVRDPSNEDERFDRVRIRKAIAGSDWLDPAAMARSAAALSDADAALIWAEESLFAERAEYADGVLRLDDVDSLPTELRRRLLIRSIRALDPACGAGGAEIERLSETLMSGGKASIGSLTVHAGDGYWEFAPAPPRRKIG